ncbi:MAG: hypothetical protein WD577_13300 [Bacteroidales bacterium]
MQSEIPEHNQTGIFREENPWYEVGMLETHTGNTSPGRIVDIFRAHSSAG